jgi:probable phosphoglycerate mutase
MAYTVLQVYADASVQPKTTGLGIAIKDGEGKLIAWRSKRDKPMTSTEAEYAALIFALQQALSYGAKDVQVYLDSKVVVEQMKGWMAVRAAHLQPLHRQARRLAERIERISISYVPRDRNQLADAIADEAINGSSLGAD